MQWPSWRYLWLTSRRDLQFRRRRFVLAVVGTALVLSLTVLISGLQQSFTQEVDRTLEALDGDGYVIRAGAAGPFTAVSQLDPVQVEAVRESPGVLEADPLITIRESVGERDPIDVYLVGHEPGGLGTPPVAAGRAVGATGEIVVDRSLDVGIGEQLALGDTDYEVVGEVDGLSVFAGTPVVFVSLEDARRTVFAGLPVATSVLTAGLPEALPEDLTAVTVADARADLLRSLESAIGSIDVFKVILWIVAASIIGVVLYLSALERTRDFAVYKATGTATVDLVLTLVIEAVLLSILAAVLAVGISWLIVPLFPMTMSVPAGVALLLPVIAVVVGVVGSLAGLRRAVTTDPALAFGAK